MMIDAHPAVAIPPETGFLPVLADLEQGEEACRAAEQIITGFHTWPDFQLEPSALRAALHRLLPVAPAAVARAFYSVYAGRFGKHRYGDKTPSYSANLPQLAALLPEARFIHLIRDGRDVTVSVRALWFRPGDSVEACAEDWANRVARTRALGALVPSYLEVHYESLVQSPEETLRVICRFLELEFDSQMLNYHVRAAARLAEHEARYAEDGSEIVSKAVRLHNQRLVTAPPRTDRIRRWQTELTEDEVIRFEGVAGEWLDRLGYGRWPGSL
jgi:hypothetical protein